MKDIYELIDEIEINEDEMVEMEASKFEKEKVKRSLKKTINKKRRKRNGLIAAGLCAAVISGFGILGTVDPAYASDIPIVGDIFKYINGRNDRYDKYKENANEINVTKESNGIEITIKDAVFDGKTIYYTYELITDRDLGESPMVGVDPDHILIEGEENTRFSTGSAACKKVSDNTYVGQDEYTMDDERTEIQCKLNFNNIRTVSKDTSEEIQGEWNFDIYLKATSNKTQVVNKSIEKDGIKFTIDNVIRTPMSLILEYSIEGSVELGEKWFNISPHTIVKDDNYKNYESPGPSYQAEIGSMHCREEFSALDENVTKLIITPKLQLSNYNGEDYIGKNGEKLEIEPIQDENYIGNAEIILDESITVELQD